MANQPLSDPLLEAFAVKVSTGIIPSHAYHEAYFPGKPLSKQSAWEGGKKRMALPVIQERIRQLSAQITRLPDRTAGPGQVSQAQSQAVKALPSIKPDRIDDGSPNNPRQALLRRLWQAVNSDTNPEAIAAVKALRDWLSDDETAAKAQQISDPAIIAKHCASIAREYADLAPALQLQYMARIITALESCGLPRDHMRQILNRADAPPIQQVPDSIDPNEPTKTDTPIISDPIQEKQCPLDANACPKAP
jgi:hypothetical protein